MSQEIPGNLQEELDSLRREVEGLRKALKEGKVQGEQRTNLEKPNLLYQYKVDPERFSLLCVKPWKIWQNHANVWMPQRQLGLKSWIPLAHKIGPFEWI